MNPLLRSLAALAALVGLLPSAHADVLTFDDLTGVKPFLTPYDGFIFTYKEGPREPGCSCAGSWFSSDRNQAGKLPYYTSPFTSISTDYEFVNGEYVYGESKPIVSLTGPIHFDGAWFTGVANDIDVTFHLYFNGAKVAQSSALVLQTNQAPVFLASGYSGQVDVITVQAYQGYFALDNFTYAPVPEPTSTALLLAGLGVAGLAARRKRRPGA